jgi:hypothetical protein
VTFAVSATTKRKTIRFRRPSPSCPDADGRAQQQVFIRLVVQLLFLGQSKAAWVMLHDWKNCTPVELGSYKAGQQHVPTTLAESGYPFYHRHNCSFLAASLYPLVQSSAASVVREPASSRSFVSQKHWSTSVLAEHLYKVSSHPHALFCYRPKLYPLHLKRPAFTILPFHKDSFHPQDPGQISLFQQTHCTARASSALSLFHILGCAALVVELVDSLHTQASLNRLSRLDGHKDSFQLSRTTVRH